MTISTKHFSLQLLIVICSWVTLGEPTKSKKQVVQAKSYISDSFDYSHEFQMVKTHDMVHTGLLNFYSRSFPGLLNNIQGVRFSRHSPISVSIVLHTFHMKQNRMMLTGFVHIFGYCCIKPFFTITFKCSLPAFVL